MKRWAGALRWLWNKALAEQQARYARGESYANYAQMCKWLTAWRNDAATNWLADGPQGPQQQVLKRLDAAYVRFFKKTGGYPKFKAYGFDPGLRFPDAKQVEFDGLNQRIKLPKLGWTRLRLSQPVTGVIRNVSLRREGNRWYASIQVLQADVLPAAGLKPTLGLDLGVAAFAATSTGVLIDPLNAYRLHQCRLRRYQRSVSRKVKGSSNRKKAVLRLGNFHRKIAAMRSDWLHKISTGLVAEHPVIALEDLKVPNMSASAKGTKDSPGKQVRQKAGLNRSILDQSWGEFARQLEYKTAAIGGTVVKVNPAYTSQGCRICSFADKSNRKSQSLFACVACGHTEQADVHAAKNILQRGLLAWDELLKQSAAGHAASAHEGNVRRLRVAKSKSAVPLKWEPTEEGLHA